MPQGKKTASCVDEKIKEIWQRDSNQTAFAVWSTLCKDLANWVPRPGQRHVASVISPLRSKWNESPQSLEPELLLQPWGANWPTSPADAEEIDCLFRLYHASLEYKMCPLTARVAKWGLKLRKIFLGPTAGPMVDLDVELLHYAFDYAMRERAYEIQGVPPSYADLDGMIAYRIWESSERFQQYQHAVESGRVAPNDPATILKDEAAIHGWDYVLSGFVKEVFWMLSRANGFWLVGSRDGELDGLGEKGDFTGLAFNIINILHMVSSESGGMDAILRRIKIAEADLEAAVQKATGTELAGYFKSWLTWWTELAPTLTESVQNGLHEEREHDIGMEETPDERKHPATHEG